MICITLLLTTKINKKNAIKSGKRPLHIQQKILNEKIISKITKDRFKWENPKFM